jgi:hypothetical protein
VLILFQLWGSCCWTSSATMGRTSLVFRLSSLSMKTCRAQVVLIQDYRLWEVENGSNRVPIYIYNYYYIIIVIALHSSSLHKTRKQCNSEFSTSRSAHNQLTSAQLKPIDPLDQILWPIVAAIWILKVWDVRSSAMAAWASRSWTAAASLTERNGASPHGRDLVKQHYAWNRRQIPVILASQKIFAFHSVQL